jgi:hypothetical protein
MARTRTTWTKANPPPNGFKPGQSGNPTGRKPSIEGIHALARQHCPAAIQALVDALKDRDRAVPAAIALLDRGIGKPAIAVWAQVNGSLVVTGIDKPPEITETYEEWLTRRRNELDALELATRSRASAQHSPRIPGSSLGSKTVATRYSTEPAPEPPIRSAPGSPDTPPGDGFTPREDAPGSTSMRPQRAMTAEEERWLEEQQRRLGLDDNTHPNPAWKQR